MVRSMMAQENLLISFWGDVLLGPTYIFNRVPSKSATSIPYELWIGRWAKLNHLRARGLAAYINDRSHKHNKLGSRGKKCIFIRYFEHSKGYVFIGENTNGSILEFESCDVIFIENYFPSRDKLQKDFHLLEMDDLDSGSHQPSKNVHNLSGSHQAMHSRIWI